MQNEKESLNLTTTQYKILIYLIHRISLLRGVSKTRRKYKNNDFLKFKSTSILNENCCLVSPCYAVNILLYWIKNWKIINTPVVFIS